MLVGQFERRGRQLVLIMMRVRCMRDRNMAVLLRGLVREGCFVGFLHAGFMLSGCRLMLFRASTERGDMSVDRGLAGGVNTRVCCLMERSVVGGERKFLLGMMVDYRVCKMFVARGWCLGYDFFVRFFCALGMFLNVLFFRAGLEGFGNRFVVGFAIRRNRRGRGQVSLRLGAGDN